MGVADFIFWGIFIAFVAYSILIYNGLIRLRNNVERAFANIEVLLKQRHTELPRLVEICKGYMKHERELLVKVVEARTLVHDAQEDHNIRALGRAETQIRTALFEVMARVEAYPELKANENMLSLQERLSQLEDAIADRREIYNESVRLNNTRIQQFPDTIYARLFKFSEEEYLKFEAEAMKAVSIGSLFDDN